MKLLRTTLLALVLGLGPARFARGDAFRLDGSAAALLSRPVSSDLSDIYNLGFGAALDLHIVYTDRVRLALSLAPGYSTGDPAGGPLTSNRSGTLLQLPVLLAVQYTHNAPASLRPYMGGGGGVLFGREKATFDYAFGSGEESRSFTQFSWTVMIGIEQRRRSRLFGEFWYVSSGYGGVDGQSGSGVSLTGIQLRLGYRVAIQ